MFNLERSINAWRQQLFSEGISEVELLDELENHLRDQIAASTAKGLSDAEAFSTAVKQFGSTESICSEFNKVEKTARWPLVVGIGFWLATVVTPLLFVLGNARISRLGPIHGMHMFTLCAGYFATFFAGAFGMIHVGTRWFAALTPARQRILQRCMVVFSGLAAALVAISVVTGFIWVQTTSKFSEQMVIRAGASMVAAIWLVTVSLFLWRKRISSRATVDLVLIGNIVVSCVWFGLELVMNYPYNGHFGTGFFLRLPLLVAFHLVFLGMNHLERGRKAAA